MEDAILKNIPTAALVEELSHRKGVTKYPSDLYQANYRAQIYRAYTEDDARHLEQMPAHYDAVIVEREAAIEIPEKYYKGIESIKHLD